MSFRLLFRALALGGIVTLTTVAAFAQEVCPEGYPIDCGTGSCCPDGNYCLPGGGCAPVGWSDCGGGSICPPGTNIYCPRLQTCYSNYETANRDGCSFEETTVCGVPAQ